MRRGGLSDKYIPGHYFFTKLSYSVQISSLSSDFCGVILERVDWMSPIYFEMHNLVGIESGFMKERRQIHLHEF